MPNYLCDKWKLNKKFGTVMGVKIRKGLALETPYNFLGINSAQTSGKHF